MKITKKMMIKFRAFSLAAVAGKTHEIFIGFSLPFFRNAR